MWRSVECKGEKDVPVEVRENVHDPDERDEGSVDLANESLLLGGARDVDPVGGRCPRVLLVRGLSLVDRRGLVAKSKRHGGGAFGGREGREGVVKNRGRGVQGVQVKCLKSGACGERGWGTTCSTL